MKGKVTVRSYEQLDEKQYYQFFLNVLDVYGYTVIGMPNNVLKVIAAKEGKRAALAQNGGEAIAEGDEVVMRVVPLRNIAAKDVSPILRQLNDSIGVGSVAHYEQGNALLITGRASVVNGLLELVREMDQDDGNRVETRAEACGGAGDRAHGERTVSRRGQAAHGRRELAAAGGG